MINSKKIVGLSLALSLSVPAFAAQFITIGTGGVTGTYYPTGGAICRMMNKNKKETGIRCSVESTGGSVYNVNNINANELDFGIAQSDTAYQGYNGEGKFKGKAVTGLRSVLAIYPELLAFVVRKDSGIKTMSDTKGKKLNIDIQGSGTRMSVDTVFDALNIKTSDLALVNELKASEGPTMLKDNKIDGYFYTVGHPTANIMDAANSVDIDLIAIDGKAIDALVSKYAYYAKGVISGTFYKGVKHDTPSIGVKAVLVTKNTINEEFVYQIAKTILDNFDEFKALHPAYKTITKESLLDGLAVPQHPGAIRAFKEAGIIK
ncbi:TAXI family TRAP transporter solute-binding subunit [Sulfurimonas sp.]|uniref:TAXI family TRAP transporter solute-binding subunit n=1 Tax=Sulfurimonas sp. TaxID=2022749 RepID=UPI0025E9B349|nr:TAXI family TRAP transporter solute-binding subunit [Sulfurimonas sp.]